MKEQSVKEQFDATYLELQEAQANHQSIVNEQTDFADRINEARALVVEKTKALRELSRGVTREISGDMRGRPPGSTGKKKSTAEGETPAAPKKRGRPRK